MSNVEAKITSYRNKTSTFMKYSLLLSAGFHLTRRLDEDLELWG